ncbi:MAG: flagellar export chaperone FliS [Firmicutes bacterium]|nr:flagellar export chaperone FliS [Bacillota bacterium]
MAQANPYALYSNDAVFTASHEELTLMLYEGALKFANQAIAAVEIKDNERANDLIMRVEDIVRELQLTLDQKYDISKNLGALYEYMHRRLVEANASKDPAALAEVRDYLRDFRDMWKEAIKVAKKG